MVKYYGMAGNRDRTGLITEGKVLIPTKLLVSYCYKTTPTDEATIEVYGVRHTVDTGTDKKPDLINATGLAVDLDDTNLKEASQVIELSSNYAICDAIVKLSNSEGLYRIREMILMAKPDELADEQEYKLTST